MPLDSTTWKVTETPALTEEQQTAIAAITRLRRGWCQKYFGIASDGSSLGAQEVADGLATKVCAWGAFFEVTRNSKYGGTKFLNITNINDQAGSVEEMIAYIARRFSLPEGSY